MKYVKNQNASIDNAFKSATKHGFYVKFVDAAIFFRKGLHWEYVVPEDVVKIRRRVEEVISHTSCCAENMDIQKLILTLKNNDETTIHVCDGEPKLAEKLYNDIQASWTNVEFGA